MYAHLHNIIRQNDNDTIIFYERTVSDLSESGLPSGPGGDGYNSKQVFSYHIYCAPTDRVTVIF
jgi:endoglycosylceramidase